MKILFLTSGRRVPSSRFRIEQYVPYLRRRGHQCVVAPSRPAKYGGWPLLGNRLSDAPRLLFRLADWLRAVGGRFDAVVIERELFSSGLGWMERWFRRVSGRLILDVDDGVFLMHPEKFAATARLCDAVVVGNRYLRDAIMPYNATVTVIPTTVDLSRYPFQPRSPVSERPVRVGWTGTAANLHQLARLREPLAALCERYPLQLNLICESRQSVAALEWNGVDVEFTPWDPDTEIADLQRFDVGLMPLDDAPWTRFKCGLKILQYMALGIPAVASPVGVNAEIIDHGRNGLLAQDADAWQQCLAELFEQPARAQRLAAAGRASVEHDYSTEAYVDRWVDVLTES